MFSFKCDHPVIPESDHCQHCSCEMSLSPATGLFYNISWKQRLRLAYTSLQPDSKVIKVLCVFFSCWSPLSMKFVLLINMKIFISRMGFMYGSVQQGKKVKIVGILILICRINFIEIGKTLNTDCNLCFLHEASTTCIWILCFS